MNNEFEKNVFKLKDCCDRTKWEIYDRHDEFRWIFERGSCFNHTWVV
jgi:hypothetical protein